MLTGSARRKFWSTFLAVARFDSFVYLVWALCTPGFLDRVAPMFLYVEFDGCYYNLRCPKLVLIPPKFVCLRCHAGALHSKTALVDRNIARNAKYC